MKELFKILMLEPGATTIRSRLKVEVGMLYRDISNVMYIERKCDSRARLVVVPSELLGWGRGELVRCLHRQANRPVKCIYDIR